VNNIGEIPAPVASQPVISFAPARASEMGPGRSGKLLEEISGGSHGKRRLTLLAPTAGSEGMPRQFNFGEALLLRVPPVL
jgi:hypothetical protein